MNWVQLSTGLMSQIWISLLARPTYEWGDSSPLANFHRLGKKNKRIWLSLNIIWSEITRKQIIELRDAYVFTGTQHALTQVIFKVELLKCFWGEVKTEASCLQVLGFPQWGHRFRSSWFQQDLREGGLKEEGPLLWTHEEAGSSGDALGTCPS